MVAARVSTTLEQVGTRQAASIQRQTQKVAQAVNQTKASLDNFPLQPGVLVTGIACSVGPVIQVVHGLNRIPTGWFAIRRYAYVSGTIGEVEAAASTTNAIQLGALGSYTADFWIF